MFTGIVEELGRVHAVERDGDHVRLHIVADEVIRDAQLGDSISVDGCCVTVTSLPGDGFTADLMAETVRVTSLARLTEGQRVNLEGAMRVGGRLGGHLVQGHVDGVGEVVGRRELPDTLFLDIAAPRELARYLVRKGSVAVSGVSLTVVDVDEQGRFTVGLIPHTRQVTSLDRLGPGDLVNLEVDVVAKYVERLLHADGTGDGAAGGTASAGAVDSEETAR